MATLTKAINKDLFDSILPTFGNPRVHVPVWDEGQKMFLCEEYESANGHRYYKGVRFCDRIVVVEKVGLYHSWTYIDSIEIYVFNGKRLNSYRRRTTRKNSVTKSLSVKNRKLWCVTTSKGCSRHRRAVCHKQNLKKSQRQLSMVVTRVFSIVTSTHVSHKYSHKSSRNRTCRTYR